MSRSASRRGRAGERAMAASEEGLSGPMRREMKPEAAHTAAHAAGDFEQLETNGANRRCRQARSGEDRSAEVGEQQQREAVQLEPEGVRAEAMTAKPISVDVELELFDPILGRAAVVVPRDDVRGAAAAVRDHEAEVEPVGGDVDLDENASRV